MVVSYQIHFVRNLYYRRTSPTDTLDIQAVWRSALGARVPNVKKFKGGPLNQYGSEHLEV